MDKKIPKFEFNNPLNFEMELTSVSTIYNKSKIELTLPHRQDFYGLFFYSNSYGSHFVDFKEYPIKKGDVYFISREQVHYFSNLAKT